MMKDLSCGSRNFFFKNAGPGVVWVEKRWSITVSDLQRPLEVVTYLLSAHTFLVHWVQSLIKCVPQVLAQTLLLIKSFD